MPLDRNVARGHGREHIVRKGDGGDRYELNTPLPDLGILGAGVPLYFDFQLRCMFLLIVSSIIFLWSQLNIIFDETIDKVLNVSSNVPVPAWPAAEWISSGSKSHLNYTTTFECNSAFLDPNSPRGVDDNAIINTCLLYVCLAVIALYFAWYPVRQEALSEQADEVTTSVDDYTLWITGFPKDVEVDEAKLFHFFDVLHGNADVCQVDIVRIVFAYDLSAIWSDLTNSMDEKDKLERLGVIESDMELIESGDQRPSTWLCPQRRARIERAKVRKEIDGIRSNEDLEEKLMTQLKNLVMVGAFVTFGSQAVAQKMERKLQGSCCRSVPSFLEAKLRVRRAGHPSDIFWRNLGESLTSKTVRRLLTLVCSIPIIAASFAIVTYLANYDFNAVQVHTASERVNEYERNVYEAICVILVNFILYEFLNFLVSYGKYSSFTSQEKASLGSSTMAAIFNSVLVVIIVHWIGDPAIPPSNEVYWYGEGGLVSEAVFLLVSNAVVTPLFFLISPFHLIITVPSRLFVNVWTSRKSQDQFNDMYLGPCFAIAGRIADILKTLFLSLIFAPLVPLAPLCGAVSLGLLHLVDRYFLLRLACRPHWYDKRMLSSVAHFPAFALAPVPLFVMLLLRTPKHLDFEYFVLCFGDALSVWRGEAHVLVSIGAVITLVLIFFPIAAGLLLSLRYVVTCQCCRRGRRGAPLLEGEGGDQNYNDAECQFLSQYHTENPAYAILPASVNPVLLGGAAPEQTVGVRGGKGVKQLLHDQANLKRMFAFLVEEVKSTRSSVMQSNSASRYAAARASSILRASHLRESALRESVMRTKSIAEHASGSERDSELAGSVHVNGAEQASPETETA